MRSATPTTAVTRTSTTRQRSHTTAGYTLLELSIVLSVLVVVGAIVLPGILGPLRAQELQSSASDLSTIWSKARYQAMRSGQIHLFRFQEGGSSYQIVPWQTGELALATELANGGSVAQGGEGFGQTGLPTPSENSTLPGPRKLYKLQQLPEGTLFVSPWITAEQAISNQGGLAATTSVGTEWSAPVVFYPDGTCSDGQLTISNPRGQGVVVRLRGLTGFSTITPVTLPSTQQAAHQRP